MNNIPLPNKKYKIIYVDPPWSYSSYKGNKKDAPTTSLKVGRTRATGFNERYYNSMDYEDLKKLPIREISDNDCFLFLWVTMPKIQEGLNLISNWGFEYKTVVFVWVKTSHSTNMPKRYGLGHYTRSNAELVLLGIKGKPKIKRQDVQQILLSEIKKHSKKPNEIRNRIIKLCGDLPRIEFFARTKIHGWDVWGNDEKLQYHSLEVFSD